VFSSSSLSALTLTPLSQPLPDLPPTERLLCSQFNPVSLSIAVAACWEETHSGGWAVMWDLPRISPTAAAAGWPGESHHFRLCVGAIRVVAAMRTYHIASLEKLAQHCHALSHTLSGQVIGWISQQRQTRCNGTAAVVRQWDGNHDSMGWRLNGTAAQKRPQCDGSKVMSTVTVTSAVVITIAAAAMATTTRQTCMPL